MSLFISITGIIFSVLSCMILLYVSIVTGIGPWIAPTLVLATSLLLKTRKNKKPQIVENQEMALIQTIGSVGALVAVAIGFTLPTLYFLDAKIFNAWLETPLYFCTLMFAATLSAGILGMYLAKIWGEKFVYQEKLKFPVSLLIHRMITSQSEGKQVKQMLLGFSSTTFFCLIRDGIFAIKGFLPKIVYLFSSVFGKEIGFSLFTGPTLWAVGFTAGTSIAIPLLVGIFSKYLVLYPINYHSIYLPYKLFDIQSEESFVLAFGGGLVLAEAILGLSKYPKIILNSIRDNFDLAKIKETIKNIISRNMMSGVMPTSSHTENNRVIKVLQERYKEIFEVIVVLCSAFAFFTYLNFSLSAQIFIIVLTLIATYQISVMGAKVGLVPFGRFATFVMIPSMLIFKLDYIQITLLCVFVNVCSAVASDLLFDYKVGELCGIKFQRVRKYQWLGLVVTALSIGILLWLILTNFEVGSPELGALRAKSRALLIQSTGFNYTVLLLGGLYGVFISKFKISTPMVLGGILMSNNISIGIILGGFCSKLFKKPENMFPFWSGVFASEAIWILVNMLLKLAGK